MLKVSKEFNKKYTQDPKFATQSSYEASVMLNVEMTDELRQMGLSREVVNRIQRLRKTSGISIEDQIEIYYESDSTLLNAVIGTNTANMEEITRMPILEKTHLGHKQVFIDETEFVDPENESERVRILIYLSGPKFAEELLNKDFGSHGNNFIDNLKTCVC